MDDLGYVRRCVKGDRQAQSEFVERYSSLIYNYIHSVLEIKGSTFPKDSINDIFQEIFLSLAKDNFKKLGTFKARNGCRLASWLRQVTVNFTIDYVRKLKPTVSIDEENVDGASLAEILPANSGTAPDMLSEKEKIRHLKDCIHKLDIDDKYFLEMYINRGLGLEELKSHLKISRGALDMRKSRILQRLRECFKGKGFVLPDNK